MEIRQTHVGPPAHDGLPNFIVMGSPHILTELRFTDGGTIVIHARNCPACLCGQQPTKIDIGIFAGKN